MKSTTKPKIESPGLPRSLKLVALMATAGVMTLSGCAIQRIDQNKQSAEGMGDQASEYINDMRNRRPLPESRPSLQKMDSLWVDTTPQQMNNRSLGAPVTALDCNITFNPKAPVSLAEFARVVTNLCGLSVQVTADATSMLNGTFQGSSGNGGGSNGASGNGNLTLTNGALPPPTLGGSGAQPGPIAISNSIFSGGPGDSISGISWVNKPLRGLLDLVTARLGLGWKYADDIATIYFLDTQVFQLYAIPGTTKMKTTVKSGAETSNSSGQTTSSFSADGSSQETGLSFESNIVRDIEKTLQTMVTPGLGRLSVSPSTGTVTITDRPDVLRMVKNYLDTENKRITRQVLLNVKVLSVQIDDSDSAGVNWNAVYESVNSKLGFNTAFAQATGGMNSNIGIIKESSRWNGTNLIINALSSQGRVSTLSSPSVTTLNLKPAPILVGRQKTYLAEVSTTAIEGGGSSQQSLTPGTITTGFNMTLLPYLMNGPEMLLEYSMNLSALNGMDTAESGGNKIQMPDVDNRIFSQSVRLRSGETLVLSGFDQTINNANKEGVGDSSFWLLGGKGLGSKQRDVIVVLITPVVLD